MNDIEVLLVVGEVFIWVSGFLCGWGFRGLLEVGVRERMAERLDPLFAHVRRLRDQVIVSLEKDHVHEWYRAFVPARHDMDFWVCLRCGAVSPGPTDVEDLDPRRDGS